MPIDQSPHSTPKAPTLSQYDPDFDNGEWFPRWRPFQGDLDTQAVAINEYLPASKSMILGVQHTFAMFGSTVLAPLLMGFDANLAILMSGICTILFFMMTGGRMPSYLGSSFAFIGPVIAVTAYAGSGLNANLGVALGGIMACGMIYALVGLLVMKIGTGWIEKLMPPIVTGAIVMIIGLNLSAIIFPPSRMMASSPPCSTSVRWWEAIIMQWPAAASRRSRPRSHN